MRLNVEPLRFALSEAFITHKGVTNEHVTHVLVTLECNYLIGYGVAVPAKEYNNTVDSLMSELTLIGPQLTVYKSPFQLVEIITSLKPKLSLAALSGVDMALHDMLSKTLGAPLYHIWGFKGLKIPDCAISLGLFSRYETEKKLIEYKDWPVLKIKMSTFDEKRLKFIRERYVGRIWIDANGAWTVEETKGCISQLERYQVEVLEQPVMPDVIQDLRELKSKSNILIFADESCISSDDVLELSGCVDGINIKLLKCGGLLHAKNMICLAKQLGLKIMLGCKVESALSVSAMANLAPLADYLDLDGHLQNRNDSFMGVAIKNGCLTFNDFNGLSQKSVACNTSDVFI